MFVYSSIWLIISIKMYIILNNEPVYCFISLADLHMFVRLNFSTPFSTNATAICQHIGLDFVTRIEHSVRYRLQFEAHGVALSETAAPQIIPSHLHSRVAAVLHDKMTQCCYDSPIESFELDICPEEVYEVNVLGEGRKALTQANTDLGWNFVILSNIM